MIHHDPVDPCADVQPPSLTINPVTIVLQGVPFTLTGTTSGDRVEVQLGDGAPFKSAAI